MIVISDFPCALSMNDLILVKNLHFSDENTETYSFSWSPG